jgi:hypothetical protein
VWQGSLARPKRDHPVGQVLAHGSQTWEALDMASRATPRPGYAEPLARGPERAERIGETATRGWDVSVHAPTTRWGWGRMILLALSLLGERGSETSKWRSPTGQACVPFKNFRTGGGRDSMHPVCCPSARSLVMPPAMVHIEIGLTRPSSTPISAASSPLYLYLAYE